MTETLNGMSSMPKEAKKTANPGEALTGPEGLLKTITATVLQAALEEEMTEHLGHEKHHPTPAGQDGNVGNGTRPKTVLTDAAGEVAIEVPRDRARHVSTTRYVVRLAGNLLRRARAEKGLTQRRLAPAAGVPQSTVARIESGAQQPSLPLLVRILAAVDLEPRIALAPYDAHDDVLDATEARLSPVEQEARTREQDEFLAALKARQQR